MMGNGEYSCPNCVGKGSWLMEPRELMGTSKGTGVHVCLRCHGTGILDRPKSANRAARRQKK